MDQGREIFDNWPCKFNQRASGHYCKILLMLFSCTNRFAIRRNLVTTELLDHYRRKWRDVRILTTWQVSGKHVLMLQLSFFIWKLSIDCKVVKHAQEENVNG